MEKATLYEIDPFDIIAKSLLKFTNKEGINYIGATKEGEFIIEKHVDLYNSFEEARAALINIAQEDFDEASRAYEERLESINNLQP